MALWLEGLELDDQGRQLIDSDLRQIQWFDQELAQLEQELACRGYESEAVKLLMTLPGVDVTTAESLLAAWGDFRRFPDAAHAASYLGLTPSTKQSANQCFHAPDHQAGQQPSGSHCDLVQRTLRRARRTSTEGRLIAAVAAAGLRSEPHRPTVFFPLSPPTLALEALATKQSSDSPAAKWQARLPEDSLVSDPRAQRWCAPFRDEGERGKNTPAVLQKENGPRCSPVPATPPVRSPAHATTHTSPHQKGG